MDNKIDITKKIIEDSQNFISKVLEYQCEMNSQINRFNNDINSMFVDCKKDFNRIGYEASLNASKIMEEVCRKEQEAISIIRSTKYVPDPPKAKNKFLNVPEKFRKTLKITNKWVPNRIPRPLWNIIIEFSDPISIAKLEKVCRMFYLLINPPCQCTDSIRDLSCRSFWRHLYLNSYPEATCHYLRRVFLRQNTVSVLHKHLGFVQSVSCAKNIHNWEVHPNNSNIIRCQCCTKGAKRLEFCASLCETHQKMCLNEHSKFTVCRNHSCISCRVPEILNSVSIIRLILAECSKYTLYPSISLTFKDNLAY